MLEMAGGGMAGAEMTGAGMTGAGMAGGGNGSGWCWGWLVLRQDRQKVRQQ